MSGPSPGGVERESGVVLPGFYWSILFSMQYAMALRPSSQSGGLVCGLLFNLRGPGAYPAYPVYPAYPA